MNRCSLLAAALLFSTSVALAGVQKSDFLRKPSFDNLPKCVAGVIKVKLAPKSFQRALGGSLQIPLVEGEPIDSISHGNWAIYNLPEGTDPEAAAKRIKGTPGVITAEPVYYLRTLLADPTDLDYGQVEDNTDLYLILDEENQGQFYRMWPLYDINAKDSWAVWPNSYFTAFTKPAHPTTIGVIDSGIDMDHPEWFNTGATGSDRKLGGQLDKSRSRTFSEYEVEPGSDGADVNGHGTHVAGIALAAGNSPSHLGHGTIGTGYACQGASLRIIGSDGVGTDVDASKAIYYGADKGMDVINMSIGGTSLSLAMMEATTYAFQKGTTLVAAAGESGTPGNLPPFYPAANPGVLAVTASGPQQIPANNYVGTGIYIDMAAPGGELLQDVFGNYYLTFLWSMMPTYHVALNDFLAYYPPIENNYTYLYGTSMASPHVAGAAGHYMAKNGFTRYGGWGNVKTMQALQQGSIGVPGGTAPWSEAKGYGDLDMWATMLDQNPRGATHGAVEGVVRFLGDLKNAVSVVARLKTQTSGGVSTNTLSNGQFRFSGLLPGEYNIIATSQFQSKTIPVTVKPGCDVPGLEFWIGGNPFDTTPPVVGRLEMSAAATANSVSVRHWGYDTETSIESMKFRIGTIAGGSQAMADRTWYPNGDVATFTGLTLASNTTYYLQVTYTNGANATTSEVLPFRVGAPLRTISGKLTLEDLSRDPYGVNGVATVYQAGTSTVLGTHPLQIQPDGSYSFKTTANVNTDIVVRANKWLSTKFSNQASTGNLVLATRSVKNGDANYDDSVDLLDYFDLSDAYNSTYGGPNWKAGADFNDDEVVDLLDYFILSDNYGQAGPV